MTGSDDHALIAVGKHRIGIKGLNRAIENLARLVGESTDEEIGHELLKKISEKNYIPTPAEDDYKKAFVREFKKHLGIPVEESSESSLQIKVFGPGCPNCERLTQRVYEVLSETGKEAEVEHVTDIKAIAAAGVLGTPALMINGKIKASGAVPTKEQVKQWVDFEG
jgi:small redox-active disulfide protein 2